MSACDRCGAAPTQQWSHKDGRDLLFCAHHGTEHTEGLRKAGFVLVWDVMQDAEVTA